MSKGKELQLTAPSESSNASPIMKALIDMESILHAESKRRQESNEMLNSYIEDYFIKLDSEIYADYAKMDMSKTWETKINQMDESLTLLEVTIEKQTNELSGYIKNYDEELNKLMDISKESVRERQLIKEKVHRDQRKLIKQSK